MRVRPHRQCNLKQTGYSARTRRHAEVSDWRVGGRIDRMLTAVSLLPCRRVWVWRSRW